MQNCTTYFFTITYNKFHRTDEAVAMLERAFSMNEDDARILMELDQLYKCVGRQAAERKALLEAHSDVVMKRDDLYLEYVTLLNQTGHYAEAVELLAKRHFHPWEGGEGKVAAQYQLVHLELAMQLLEAQRFDEALKNVEACYVYPLNLGEGKLQGAAENDFDYYRGLILERLNRNEEAREAWAKASVGLSEPVAAIFYNDQKPDKIFYQGLALLKLWRNEEALQRFDRLIAYGEAHHDDKFKIDYFAVSLPDLQIWEKDMERVNRVHCLYLIGLGYLGKKQFGEARKYLEEAYALDPNHQGVAVHLQMVEKEIAK